MGMEHTHSPDSELSSNIGNNINVELVEIDLSVILGKGYDLWRNKPTGTYSE